MMSNTDMRLRDLLPLSFIKSIFKWGSRKSHSAWNRRLFRYIYCNDFRNGVLMETIFPLQAIHISSTSFRAAWTSSRWLANGWLPLPILTCLRTRSLQSSSWWRLLCCQKCATSLVIKAATRSLLLAVPSLTCMLSWLLVIKCSPATKNMDHADCLEIWRCSHLISAITQSSLAPRCADWELRTASVCHQMNLVTWFLVNWSVWFWSARHAAKFHSSSMRQPAPLCWELSIHWMKLLTSARNTTAGSTLM